MTSVHSSRKCKDGLGSLAVTGVHCPRGRWESLIGALDQAYAIVNRALDEHIQDGWIGATASLIFWRPEMRSLWRDARFQQLVTRFKLIDYWKQYGPPDDCDLHGDLLVCR